MAERAPPLIFSTPRRIARFERAMQRQRRSDAARFVLDEIADDIAERLAFMRFEAKRALVLGELTGRVADGLKSAGVAVTSRSIGALDEEKPLPEGGFDLIISINAFDTVNDLPGALIHLRNALADGGLAIGTFPSAGSLPILRAAILSGDGDRPAARLHPMVDPQAGAGLMQRAGFARQVADSYSVNASYLSLDQLVSDLRDQGLTSALSSKAPTLSKTAIQTARNAFLEGANERDRVIETFEIMTLTGWKS